MTVLLIEDHPDYAELVQNWLTARSEMSFVLTWADTLQSGLNRLRQGGVDVILLDLSLPDSEGLATYSRTRLKAQGVPIILLSGDDREEAALQMVQDGAQDYIVKSSCNSDILIKAIQYALMRNQGRAERMGAGAAAEPNVIGVMGVKGGVGVTTIACHLGVELQRLTAKETLLMDLDLDGGMMGFMMAAESKYSMLDAVENLSRLDASFWQGMVARRSGVDVLVSPAVPGTLKPEAEEIKHVLEIVRKLYGWVIVDLARASAFSLVLQNQLTELFLVTTASIPALYEAKQTINSLRQAGLEKDRLKLIVNQTSGSQQFSRSQLDKLLGVPVYAHFSPADQELHEACVKKEVARKSGDFSTQTRSLARKLAGLPPEIQKGRVSRLFSFSSRSPAVETDQPETSAL